MNLEEAKRILELHRPGVDQEDSRVRQALELSRTDPDLNRWYRAELQLNHSFHAALASAPAPAGLEAQILAGVKRRQMMDRRSFLAVAAGFTLLGGGLTWWKTRPQAMPPDSFARCRTDLAEWLTEFPKLDLLTEKPEVMRQWVAEKIGWREIDLPLGLNRFPGIGCRTVPWRGQTFALLCFMVDGDAVHVVVMPKTAFPDADAIPLEPAYSREKRMSSAFWTRSDKIYLVLSKGSPEFLRSRLFQQA